jgi:hypothetical protein
VWKLFRCSVVIIPFCLPSAVSNQDQLGDGTENGLIPATTGRLRYLPASAGFHRGMPESTSFSGHHTRRFSLHLSLITLLIGIGTS